MTVRTALLVAAILPMLLPERADGATVAEIEKMVNDSLSREELQEAGSPARAKAWVEVMKEELGLAGEALIDARLMLAEAWLDAGDAQAAQAAVLAAVAVPAATIAQRERAGLAWVAAWQVRLRASPSAATVEPVVPTIDRLGAAGPLVRARAHTADAQRLLAMHRESVAANKNPPADPTVPVPAAPDAAAGTAILSAFDAAIEALKESAPEERVPIYTLRLLAMEELGAKPDAVHHYLQSRSADPAAALVGEQAFTGGQKLIGQNAPALTRRRIDGVAGTVDLATLRGRPVLIYFFATWSQPCDVVTPVVAQVGARPGAVVIGVSIDTKDTVGNLPAYVARFGITFPVIGDGIGWDTEIDDAWHVDGIPALIVIDAGGRIAAIDLVADQPTATLANIDRALGVTAAVPVAPGPARIKPAAPAVGGDVIP